MKEKIAIYILTKDKPKKVKKCVLSVRIAEQVVDYLKIAAKDRGLSIRDLITPALEQIIKPYKGSL